MQTIFSKPPEPIDENLHNTPGSGNPLKRGYIYRFEYRNYHEDPNPLALILWSGREKTHAININYLKPKLRDELIDMIAQIAGSRLDASDAYAFYHDYFKKKLPYIIRRAYRTYFTSKIKHPTSIARGFFEIKYFLGEINKELNPKQLEILKVQIKKSIESAKELQKSGFQPFSLFRKDESITTQELHRRSSEYVNRIKEIVAQTKRKEDMRKYTRS